MDLLHLKKELDNNKRRSLYIFVGREKELMLDYAKRIDPKYMKTDKLEAASLHASSKSLFVSSSRLYLVDNDMSAATKGRSELQAVFNGCTLILIYSQIDNRSKLFAEAADCIVNFDEFSDASLINYIKRHLNISEKLAAVIVQYCSSNYSRVKNEVAKMQELDTEIDLNIINELIQPDPENRVFEFVDALARKDFACAFEQYKDLQALGEVDIKLLSLIHMKFKAILLTQFQAGKSDDEISEKTGINSYQLKKSRSHHGFYTNNGLMSILKFLHSIEIDAKTGRVQQDGFIPYIMLRLTQTT